MEGEKNERKEQNLGKSNSREEKTKKIMSKRARNGSKKRPKIRQRVGPYKTKFQLLEKQLADTIA